MYKQLITSYNKISHNHYINVPNWKLDRIMVATFKFGMLINMVEENVMCMTINKDFFIYFLLNIS